MPSPFPIELWILIVRHAVARPWKSNQFNPPIGDFDCVEGFAETSTAFKEIVEAFKNEALVISWLDFPQISDNVAQRLRHLEMTDIDTFETYSFAAKTHYLPSFFCKISHFSQLTSLSLSPPKDLCLFLNHLQKLPVSRTLRHLDIDGSMWRNSRIDVPPTTVFGSSILCFPNLLRLRIFEEPLDLPGTIDEHFVSGLASFLSGSQNLKLLSFHAALDDDAALVEQLSIHRTSIEHLQPSEGYERHMVDCPLCTDSYDHASVVRRENVATLILAQKLPNLTEVRWAHTWIRTREDESGQRGTTILREGNNMVLSRNEGRRD